MRRRMNFKKSKRLFRRHAGTHKRNRVSSRPKRGGGRM